ncbi:hypothetical protein [Mesorhizobium sp. 10J20-29]
MTMRGPISEDTLARALAGGVLTADQVEALHALEQEGSPPGSSGPADSEQFRFITGFGDIFVTIGLALFLGALTYFARGFIGDAGARLAAAAACWLLAEYFTRQRRMALPSIVLLLVFAVSIFLSIADPRQLASVFSLGIDVSGWPAVLAGLVTAAATALHYLRFRVPITIAAGAAALVASIVALFVLLAPDLASRATVPLIFVCGIGVFALAMRFDLSDPARQTRRTDIAFWLHMLAAPLIVHPLVSGFVGGGSLDTASALAVLTIFIALSLVALIVDRRAILVAGLSYAGIAFGTLVANAGLTSGTAPLTLLVLGALVLLLSAGWHGLRRLLLPLLPVALVHRLPPHT